MIQGDLIMQEKRPLKNKVLFLSITFDTLGFRIVCSLFLILKNRYYDGAVSTIRYNISLFLQHSK